MKKVKTSSKKRVARAIISKTKPSLVEFLEVNQRKTPCLICDNPGVNEDLIEAIDWMVRNRSLVPMDKVFRRMQETYGIKISRSTFHRHISCKHNPLQSEKWKQVSHLR